MPAKISLLVTVACKKCDGRREIGVETAAMAALRCVSCGRLLLYLGVRADPAETEEAARRERRRGSRRRLRL